jgi:hypothetical protein
VTVPALSVAVARSDTKPAVPGWVTTSDRNDPAGEPGWGRTVTGMVAGRPAGAVFSLSTGGLDCTVDTGRRVGVSPPT